MEIINKKEYYDINEVAADLSISRQGALTKIETFLKVHPDAKQYVLVREGKHANFYCEDLFAEDKMGLPVGKNSIKRITADYQKKISDMEIELAQLRERTKSQQETIDRLTADAQKMSDTITQLTQSNTTLSSANYLATLNNKRIDAAFRSLSATPLMSRLFGWNAAVQTAALLTQDIIETASDSEKQ